MSAPGNEFGWYLDLMSTHFCRQICNILKLSGGLEDILKVYKEDLKEPSG